MAQAKLDELVGVAQNNWAAPQFAYGGSLTADVANFNDVPIDTNGDPLSYRRRWAVTAGPNDPGWTQVSPDRHCSHHPDDTR